MLWALVYISAALSPLVLCGAVIQHFVFKTWIHDLEDELEMTEASHEQALDDANHLRQDNERLEDEKELVLKDCTVLEDRLKRVSADADYWQETAGILAAPKTVAEKAPKKARAKKS